MGTDTIAAIATALTNAGLGIIRLSGQTAIETADKIVRLKCGKPVSACGSHTIHYGFVKEGERTVDEVMVALMKAPNSYTREDTVEINCHGGVLVMQQILGLLLKNGARPAEPGEFTKRAFLNGRIDLAQAESVMDVIQAQNDFALKASMDQLKGKVSDTIRKLREEILYELAYIESALDDPEHYELDQYGSRLLQKTEHSLEAIRRLLLNAENGFVLKEGIHTVIVGKPNSGKSSLLNALTGTDRAIVTDIAGTTRDAIEEQIRLNGISLHVTDTAGIRMTDDEVERIGVERAKEYIEKSDLVIYVVDASVPLDRDDLEIAERIRDRNVIVLLNKSDLDAVVTREDITEILDQTVLTVSAKYGEGIEQLEHTVEELFFHDRIRCNDEVFITNERHKASLRNAEKSLCMVKQSIADGMPEDFYTIDLMDAYRELGSVIGEEVADDLVNEIFSKFCMGK